MQWPNKRAAEPRKRGDSSRQKTSASPRLRGFVIAMIAGLGAFWVLPATSRQPHEIHGEKKRTMTDLLLPLPVKSAMVMPPLPN